MDTGLKDRIFEKWKKYFPNAELPVAVFYADELHGAEHPDRPQENPRGYTCIYAQLSAIHRGKPLAFSRENLGCFGSVLNLFGGDYNEDATVHLLVDIEKFKIDREQTNAIQKINPAAHPTGKYLIFKPLDTLSGADKPEIFVVFCRPDTIAALHGLASYDNTRIDNVIVPFGSGCECAFKFPLAECGKKDPRCVLGGMDSAMRNCLKPDIQTFSAPAKVFYRMMENADKSFLSTYIWEHLKNR